MEKELFQKLTVEQKFSVISTHLNIMKDSIYTRMSLLATISGLFITFLVVATFNEKLIPLDNIIRVVLSVLILFVPLSLYFYNYDLKKSVEKSRKNIEDLIGEIPLVQTWKDKIIYILPDILISIFSIISIIIVSKILSCFWSVCS